MHKYTFLQAILGGKGSSFYIMLKWQFSEISQMYDVLILTNFNIVKINILSKSQFDYDEL